VIGLSIVTGYAQEKSKEEIEREKKFQELAAKAGRDTSKNYGWTHNVATSLNVQLINEPTASPLTQINSD